MIVGVLALRKRCSIGKEGKGAKVMYMLTTPPLNREPRERYVCIPPLGPFPNVDNNNANDAD